MHSYKLKHCRLSDIMNNFQQKTIVDDLIHDIAKSNIISLNHQFKLLENKCQACGNHISNPDIILHYNPLQLAFKSNASEINVCCSDRCLSKINKLTAFL